VRTCISADVLTIERVRQQYIQAYHMLHAQCQQQQQEQCNKTADTYQITPDKIESLIKDFKMHRCALDFDKGFIKAPMIT
jgi:hypothetical protein